MTAFLAGEMAKGWLLPGEGEALYRMGLAAAPDRVLVELGSYAGKSTCYLGQAAKEQGTFLFTVDHHRGSPEMAAGNDCHDPELIGPDGHDSLPFLRRTLKLAELENNVFPIVGKTASVGLAWRQPIAALFIDAGHDGVSVLNDYLAWSRRVIPGGFLAFHDATIPAIGAVVDRAIAEGFEPYEQVGCLRILRRCS